MTAEAVLTGLPIWQAHPELIAVEEGRTNRNFIIRDGETSYFGRVGVDLPHHGISRANERICAELAANLGVSPKVHYAGDGVLITEFIEGQTLRPATMHDREIVAQTAMLLKRLHGSPVRSPGIQPRCGVAMALAYLQNIPDDELPLTRELIAERLGPPGTGGDRLVHCDIIPENLMRGSAGLFLIDWEYGGVGFPEIDLASVIANADLSAPETAELLDAYGPYDPERMTQQRRALVVREALWCITQMRHAGPAGDLIAYSQTCIERMLKEFS